MGESRRQAVGQTRQPLIDDLHVANLYSDKVFAERAAKAAQTECNTLRATCDRLEADLHNARREAKKAYDCVDQLPELLQQRYNFDVQAVRMKHILTDLYAVKKARDKALDDAAKAARQQGAYKSAAQLASSNVKQLKEGVIRAV